MQFLIANKLCVGPYFLRQFLKCRSVDYSQDTYMFSSTFQRKITTNVQAKQELPTSQGLSSSASTQIPLAERMTHNLEFYSGNVPTLSQIESSGPKTLAPSEPNRRARPSVVLPVTSKLRPGNGITEGVAKTSTILSPSSVNNIQRTAQHPLSQESTMPTSISFCHDNKASPPQPYPSQSMSTSFPNAPPQQINARAIQHFLQTCLPPMDHLLHHFVDAGLRTEEGLLAASRWPRELIESFLDQLPPLPDGSPVLLMDKIVLMHQFATYFL